MGVETFTQIPSNQPVQIPPELYRHRLVEPVFLVDLGDLLRIRIWSGDGRPWVGRHVIGNEEDDDDQPEERRDETGQPHEDGTDDSHMDPIRVDIRSRKPATLIYDGTVSGPVR